MTHVIPGTKYKVRFQESFKDGNIFGERNIRPGEELEITAEQFAAAARSGAVMDVLDTVIKNPLKEKDPEEKKGRGKT